MVLSLRSSDDELRDLVQGSPFLVDDASGENTGIQLVRWIGAGGMATVFLGNLDPSRRSTAISPLAPRQIAIKFSRLSTERQLARMNLSALDIFKKELLALGRVMERRPPTDFVVGLFGSGASDIEVDPGVVRRLPWLAIEFVDSGAEGATLTDRVLRTDGMDPLRSIRLIRGMLEGVRVLHEMGVIHRDLKPDNVFVSGPIDDETPKIADCGIARVEGVAMGTIAAMTPAYGGPEQILSTMFPTRSNPLIGAWTDVHALAAIVWFVVGGEEWCRSDGDRAWHAGERRSLRTARKLHSGFTGDEPLLDALDAVLRRAAAHRLPDRAWHLEGARDYEPAARLRFSKSMSAGPDRYATVEEFGAALVPVLAELTKRWVARAVRENRSATALRPTKMLAQHAATTQKLASVREATFKTIAGTDLSMADPNLGPATANNVVFQPDGRVLARFGDRLLYFVDGRAHKVGVPKERAPAVAETRWVGRGPGGGFCLIGPEHILLIRNGGFVPIPLPAREGGGEVGAIQAVVADGRTFGVVTAETDDSEGGAELWISTDGVTWNPPTVLPLGADVNAVAPGPFGALVVGAHRGKKARALYLGLDGQVTIFTKGVNDKPPLTLATSGAQRDSWAAGQGIVLRLERSDPEPSVEALEDDGVPVAMGLDLVGLPWLVTQRAVMRRHEGPSPTWKVYYRRSEAQPALVGIGFTLAGAQVIDTQGGHATIEPSDIESWRVR